MASKIYTQPATEPVSLQEARRHLILDSAPFEEAITVAQSIIPGAHGIAAAYSLKGAGVDVSAAGSSMAVLEAGSFGSPGGAVTVKLQESDTDVEADYKDVAGGAFDQVSPGNDNATFNLAYAGTKKYVRAVATVAGAACEFAVSIITKAPSADDDEDVFRVIKASRRHCEDFQNRAYITQAWDLYLDGFPCGDTIRLPKPPLQAVTHVKYKDANGVLQTLATGEYIVDTFSEPGRIVLASGKSWPSTYDEIQAVQIRYTAGYGAAADVPAEVKQAILLKAADLWEHRGEEVADQNIERAVENLLWPERMIQI